MKKDDGLAWVHYKLEREKLWRTSNEQASLLRLLGGHSQLNVAIGAKIRQLNNLRRESARGYNHIGAVAFHWTTPEGDGVTSDAVFPRRCLTIFRPISRIPFRPYQPTETTERASGIGYSPV
jgi:hypothetical protein